MYYFLLLFHVNGLMQRLYLIASQIFFIYQKSPNITFFKQFNEKDTFNTSRSKGRGIHEQNQDRPQASRIDSLRNNDPLFLDLNRKKKEATERVGGRVWSRSGRQAAQEADGGRRTGRMYGFPHMSTGHPSLYTANRVLSEESELFETKRSGSHARDDRQYFLQKEVQDAGRESVNDRARIRQLASTANTHRCAPQVRSFYERVRLFTHQRPR